MRMQLETESFWFCWVVHFSPLLYFSCTGGHLWCVLVYHTGIIPIPPIRTNGKGKRPRQSTPKRVDLIVGISNPSINPILVGSTTFVSCANMILIFFFFRMFVTSYMRSFSVHFSLLSRNQSAERFSHRFCSELHEWLEREWTTIGHWIWWPIRKARKWTTIITF